ncbi:MAG TPA: tail fiber protein [Polyangiaceae bacterium]|nr:tail fiber protein [Polyangiaceae bacterium]
MEPFIGEIRIFTGNFAPQGWALCNGQLLPISQNQALFAILGNTYGGDGRQTFGLPDLRGRVAIHAGQGAGLSAYNLGQTGGNETVTLESTQLPPHTHAFAPACSSSTPDAVDPANAVPAAVESMQLYSGSANASMQAANTTAAGGGQAHNNVQPYLAVNFIIALQGIFPSRG